MYPARLPVLPFPLLRLVLTTGTLFSRISPEFRKMGWVTFKKGDIGKLGWVNLIIGDMGKVRGMAIMKCEFGEMRMVTFMSGGVP